MNRNLDPVRQKQHLPAGVPNYLNRTSSDAAREIITDFTLKNRFESL